MWSVFKQKKNIHYESGISPEKLLQERKNDLG